MKWHDTQTIHNFYGKKQFLYPENDQKFWTGQNQLIKIEKKWKDIKKLLLIFEFILTIKLKSLTINLLRRNMSESVCLLVDALLILS